MDAGQCFCSTKNNFFSLQKVQKREVQKRDLHNAYDFCFFGAVFILEESEAYITFLVVTSEEWPERGHDAMGGWWIGFWFEVS